MRVLSFGAFVAGNTPAIVLADLGADVVKIESRNRPDFLRNAAYGYGDPLQYEPSGVSTTPMQSSLARGAKGLALDMTTPEGRALFLRLVAVTDVVSENFGAHVMASWGASYAELSAVNPRLVMLSQSGYGRTGRRASYLAYASNISNFTGLTAVWANSGMFSDYATAMHGAVAVVAALDQARRTGTGVHVDAAQIEVMASLLAPVVMEPLVNGRDAGPQGNEVPGSLLAGVYRCRAEDSWVAVELEDLDDWHVLCTVIGRSDLDVPDEHGAAAGRPALAAALEAWTAELSALTAAQRLQHVGLAAGAVQDGDDIVRDPQLRHRHFPVEIDHPDLGPIEFPGSPHRMTKTPGAVERLGPRVGEHTGAVLGEWLGLGEGELVELEQAGVIFRAPE